MSIWQKRDTQRSLSSVFLRETQGHKYEGRTSQRAMDTHLGHVFGSVSEEKMFPKVGSGDIQAPSEFRIT